MRLLPASCLTANEILWHALHPSKYISLLLSATMRNTNFPGVHSREDVFFVTIKQWLDLLEIHPYEEEPVCISMDTVLKDVQFSCTRL